MEEDPKSASSARSEDTSRPSSSSKTGQKHEAPQSAGAASISATSDPQQQSKRRRGLGIVTPNACTECRKKRAKVRFTFFSNSISLLCGSLSSYHLPSCAHCSLLWRVVNRQPTHAPTYLFVQVFIRLYECVSRVAADPVSS